MNTQRQHHWAVATVVLCTFLWSIAGVVTRKLEVTQGFEVTFWRSFFCALSLLIWLLYRNGRHAFHSLKQAGKFGLLSGLLWATMFTCFMLALTKTTVANTLIVNSLFPLIAALLSWWCLHEKISNVTWAAIAFATLGMGLMFKDGMDGNLGTLIAFGVPIAAAVNVVVLKKVGATLDLIPSVLLGGIFSCLLMLPMSLPFTANAHDLALLAVLGLAQLAIPCSLYVVASKHLSASELPLLCLLEVVLGPLWTWLFANEVPSHATLVGGGIVLLALVFNETVSAKNTGKDQ
ncbi:MAG: hypothetical protein RLZZ502_1744 [Pseudomonadota bacterium]|jgi:drug/metabolite transporter (DMT)-like permease